MKRFIAFSLLFICISNFSGFSQKKVTLEDIWLGGKFYPQLLRGYSSMNDGENYTVLEVGRDIDKYSYKTGKKVGTVLSMSDITDENKPKSIDEYFFNADETKVMVSSDVEGIYRHSSKGFYYIIDLKTKKMIPVCNDGKQQLADFSPKSDKVAYMFDNNLYIKNLNDEKVTTVTSDGKFNFIINGAPDWVYEEEFGYAKAFEWSPDGTKIAYVKFDETNVKQFTLTYYGELYPEEYKYKYPKAGEGNSIVSVHIYDLNTGKTVTADIGTNTDIYIPRIKWTNDGKLCITRLNRLQNQLDLLLADAVSGKTNVMLHEENQYFVDIHDDLTFLSDNKQFIWISEKDKWKHIYLYDVTGKEIRQITKGNWCVVDFLGINEKTQTLYYISTEESPTERSLYSIKLDGTGKKLLSKRKGVNDVEFCNTYKYYINTWSDANTPYYVSVNDESGKEIREIINNEALIKTMEEYDFVRKEFGIFKNSKGTDLHYYIMKPGDFDPTKKYPVFIHLYGGPGSQQVMNEWGWFDYAFYQLLTQKGYIVACVDNTGTDFRGEDFSKATYMKMGKLESDDQIEFAKFLGSLNYVDKTRIGIEGWSYGGTMSALCLMRGNDIYKMAISTAPVMNWRYYDNIYSERYMRTPQENPSGYDDYSPINHVKNLKGKLLLIHGTADDNVHVQNSMDFVTALVNANKQFDMMLYPNKNHGIYGGYTRIHLYTKWLEYILENL